MDLLTDPIFFVPFGFVMIVIVLSIIALGLVPYKRRRK